MPVQLWQYKWTWAGVVKVLIHVAKRRLLVGTRLLVYLLGVVCKLQYSICSRTITICKICLVLLQQEEKAKRKNRSGKSGFTKDQVDAPDGMGVVESNEYRLDLCEVHWNIRCKEH
jgi:hypothetical protein